MKSLFLLTTLLIAITTFAQTEEQKEKWKKYNYSFKYDGVNERIFYENVLEFNEKPLSELKKVIGKLLAINRVDVSFQDDKEIYATGKFSTRVKSWVFPVFFNNKDYTAVYDIQLSFKDNKIRYRATNFYLIPKHYSVSVTNWFGGGIFSTAKIPTDVPKRQVEVHLKRKIKPSRKLFPSLELNMKKFEESLIEAINAKEESW
jgi:hypothetical protein